MADESENITDIVNELVGDNETDTEQIEQPVEQTPQTDTKTAKRQESAARGQAIQDIKHQQNASVVQDAKKQTMSYKQQIEELTKRYADLEKAIKERDSRMDAMSKNLQVHSDRMLTDDVIAKENQLAKHEKYAKYYDRDAVRKHYIDAATNEKRYFDPGESFKILNFDKVLDLLEKYERQNEFRKSMFQGASASSSGAPKDELSDVKDPEAAYQYMRKRAADMGL